jgi:PAS domain S-box-containing protein
MMDLTDSSPEEIGRIRDGRDEPEQTRIYPLVSESGNRRVLTEWLADHDTYTCVDEMPIAESDFDLCIVDHAALERHETELKQIKSDAYPTLVPVLLLMPERRTDVIETDQGIIADSVFATTVDEIVSLPIRQTELEWRIKALLRLRDQSLTAQTNTEQLRRFRQAVEASGHAIFITDANGIIEYVNPAFEQITGYDQETAIGKTPHILNSGEMSSAFFGDLWDTIRSGEVWEDEVINRKQNGDLYTAYQTIAPMTDEAGEVEAFVAVQTDITKRKELRNRLKRHRDIVQRLEDPIMLQDMDGTFQLVNEAVTKFAGLNETALLGEDESLFMGEESATAIDRRKRGVIQSEEPVEYSITPTFERTDEQATFSTRRYPYYDENGDLAGTIAICRDVTGLEERTRQLEVIDNILRHNLRNSLTVIRNEARQAQEDVSGETATRIETILDHADSLESTGEKSRAITKVLSEEPTRKSIGLAASARAVVETVRTDHPEADITVDAPEHVIVSATFNIDEAIEELVRNAIVHNDSESPAIELHVRVEDTAITLHVIDNGSGMSEMDREVLETGRATADLYHGSGLGLWLVYWVVSRSGGSIAVTDSGSDGTDVAITLSQSASGGDDSA